MENSSFTFTPEQLAQSLKGDKFWLNNDSDEARVVKEATAAGFVFRGSHTQAHWTQSGLDWYYQSLQGQYFEATQDTSILYTYQLGGGILGGTVKKGDKVRFLCLVNTLGNESVSTYETLHRINKACFFEIFKPVN